MVELLCIYNIKVGLKCFFSLGIHLNCKKIFPLMNENLAT